MFCLECNKISHSKNDKCEHCGAVLKGSKAPDFIDSSVQELKFTVHRWEIGVIDDFELLDWIEQKEKLYRDIIRSVDSIDAPREVLAGLAEEIKYGKLGIEGTLNALEAVRSYIKSGNKSYREEAYSLAESGNRMVNKAMNINFDSYKNLQDCLEELLEATTSNSGPQEFFIS